MDHTQNTNYISVPHHDIRMWILLKESTTSSLCSDIFIACYSFCATLSTLVNGIPIISTVHSNTSFKMTTYVLCKSLHCSMWGERERTSDDYHYQTTNLIRTYFVNTNTRKRVINPLDPIVSWITHKIQTILVFLIMIYECEFYFWNLKLHLYQWRRKMSSSRWAEKWWRRARSARIFFNITLMGSHSFAHLGWKKLSATRCTSWLSWLMKLYINFNHSLHFDHVLFPSNTFFALPDCSLLFEWNERALHTSVLIFRGAEPSC